MQPSFLGLELWHILGTSTSCMHITLKGGPANIFRSENAYQHTWRTRWRMPKSTITKLAKMRRCLSSMASQETYSKRYLFHTTFVIRKCLSGQATATKISLHCITAYSDPEARYPLRWLCFVQRCYACRAFLHILLLLNTT